MTTTDSIETYKGRTIETHLHNGLWQVHITGGNKMLDGFELPTAAMKAGREWVDKHDRLTILLACENEVQVYKNQLAEARRELEMFRTANEQRAAKLVEGGSYLSRIHKRLDEQLSEVRECNHYTSEYPEETQRAAQNANAIMDALMLVNQDMDRIEELAQQFSNHTVDLAKE
jgi:uncharacterized coiled-coil DUF342 family protein